MGNLIEVIESGALGEKDGNKDAASPLIGTKAPQPMVGTLDSTAAGRRRPPSLQVPRRQQAARGADSPLSPPCWSPASPGGAGIARSYSINSVALPDTLTICHCYRRWQFWFQCPNVLCSCSNLHSASSSSAGTALSNSAAFLCASSSSSATDAPC